jgi:hypothetical protein
MKKLCIAVDYDGTIVTNDFPNKGKDIGAASVLKKIIAAGHDIILYTCRQNHKEDRHLSFGNDQILTLPAGDHLTEAMNWFYRNDIPLFDINHNPAEDDYITEKPHFDLLIDDKALGVPTTTVAVVDNVIVSSKKPFVDWVMIEYLLTYKNII